jgi:hypothetical protein
MDLDGRIRRSKGGVRDGKEKRLTDLGFRYFRMRG